MRRKADADNGFEKWGGYMNAKIAKLQDQFQEEAAAQANSDDLFKGISIFVNGYTEPSTEELRRIMLRHGGVFNDYEVSTTTHIIASNLPNAKLVKKSSARVVRPEWIVESVAAGKLLPITSYLLCPRQALQPSLHSFSEGKKVKTAKDSGFISEFYNNSRLHHLSTMGALLKQYVVDLKEKHTGSFPGLDRLKKSSACLNYNRVIMHIDMDCFFVSVALRDQPELKGKPVAVTHAKGNAALPREGADPEKERALYESRARNKGIHSKLETKIVPSTSTKRDSRSEVASCSYEARAKGVKNGMYLGGALSLCPDLITVPYDFESYTQVSYLLYNTVAEYTLNVEAVSCDELFIDCTHIVNTRGVSPLEFAEQLRNEVKARTGCPCSAGLGANKLQARLASRRAKPDGKYYVDDVSTFMHQVKVRDLPGVGWSTCAKLKDLQVDNCFDLQSLPLSVLKEQLGGKTGETIYRYCRGQDDRPLMLEHQRKSVSAEVNYGIRFTSNEDAERFFQQLSEEVAERVRNLQLKGRVITLKVMYRSADAPAESAKFLGHGVCDSVSKSLDLKRLTDNGEEIFEVVFKLYKQMEIPPMELRGIGIQVTKLEQVDGRNKIKTFFERKKREEVIECKQVKKTSEKAPSVSKASIVKSPKACDLDPEVLKCLPKEILTEVMNEYNIRDNSCQNDLLVDLTTDEMRDFIRGWLLKEAEPKQFDIDILAIHLSELVRKRHLEDVELLVRCFYRLVKAQKVISAPWIGAYNTVIDHVQKSMVELYQKRLRLPNFKL